MLHVPLFNTLYLDTVKTSGYKIIIENKTDLNVCRVGVRGGELATYLLSKISKRSNGSKFRWKAIPQMCPTVHVAETTFQKISTGLT